MASCGRGKCPLLPAAVSIFLAQLLCHGHAARLYSSQDLVTVLEADSVKGLLVNSSAAWVVEFYSSWCGHCVSYAPTWKALARDVKDDRRMSGRAKCAEDTESLQRRIHSLSERPKAQQTEYNVDEREVIRCEWELAIRIGVMDCADEKNFAICGEYGIHFYPTFRYFKALATQFTTGESYKGPNRELETMRQIMIDFLQNHTSANKPPACPMLSTASSSSVLTLLGKHQKHYTAVIFEKEFSYIGREVILDLMQYENIIVKRVLDTDTKLMEKLGIRSLPSCYLFYPNGSRGLIYMQKPLRSFFSSYLKSLSGVTKRQSSQYPAPVRQKDEAVNLIKPWKYFDRNKLYMADLESGLHYILRVELASHKILEGPELSTLKDFITVLSKLFPGQQPAVKLLEMLQEWLVSLPLDKIPYNAILDLVNNKMRISGMFLTNRVDWVGCQGSQPQYRGYPCSLWTLFHTLTVHAATRPTMHILPGFDSPQVVLQVIRKYIHYFFGCRECAQHFEAMAKESMDKVTTLDDAILWLWRKHNEVNNRLAGAPSEDPMFPKVAWPTPNHCPTCHEEIKGLHTWNEKEVLIFLKSYYSVDNISLKYSEYELQVNKTKKAALENNQSEVRKQVLYQLSNGHKEQNANPQNPAQNPRLGTLIKQEKGDLADSGQKRISFHQETASLKKESKQSVSFFGIGFSNVDMSLCVMLYAASCFFIMVMYFYFQMRSKKWKIRHVCPVV
ncbi:sulfhydryl oxidase 2 isoform X1 [Stegostoma tigrinum]|uniref:sulfhydryl oxidase 2 isoform X1 n=2 Tax=Stegostoma tigrinum TaxID=3053191 RepID=UPI00202AEDE4|nr:sulfhydryl oxidase 2 isoform X1 [Stegostoma tigrinum]